MDICLRPNDSKSAGIIEECGVRRILLKTAAKRREVEVRTAISVHPDK
jgi:hypothetical protein